MKTHCPYFVMMKVFIRYRMLKNETISEMRALIWVLFLLSMKTWEFFCFSSIGEEQFGFGCLISKQTPLEVLLGFIAMIEIEN